MAGFALVSDAEFDDLLDDVDATNTKKQIQYAVKRLEAYAIFVGKTITDVEAYTIAELDQFLSRFYASLRKADGNLYQKKSFQGIWYGLQRHFRSTRDFDITKRDQFRQSEDAYKAMMVKLKKAGKGAVTHKKAVSKEDMARIFDSEAVDISTPLGLQNKVFLDIMIYFANRGRENLRDMKAEDFQLHTDEQGIQFITHRDMMTKSRRENEDEECSGFMYQIPGSPRCPVASFIAYKEALNPECECFWQRPKASAPADGPWFNNAPLGVNSLGLKMKSIAEVAGCNNKYTNHSLRDTTVQVLDRAGFASRDIMSVTGHRSESSLKHYSVTSGDRKKEMSGKIAHKMMPESTRTPTSSSAPATVSTRPTTPPTSEDLELDSILTLSQEQLNLQESNFSIQNATSSSVQHFHFHGPVTFYNNKST